MTRALTATMESEVAAASIRPVIFYEGVFASGTQRLCSLPYTISWNGQSWLGAGNLLGIGPIQETTEIRETQFTVTLQASAEIAALALAQVRLGKAGSVWVGTLDSSGAVNADPFLAFEGRLDKPVIQVGERPVVSITYGSKIRDLERPRVIRLTHEAHKQRFPGDDFCEYGEELVDKSLSW